MINLRKGKIRLKTTIVFSLIFSMYCPSFFSQEIFHKIFESYCSGPLSYSFTVETYKNQKKIPFHWNGTCDAYTNGTNVRYRLKINQGFDTVVFIRNEHYFGCNKINRNQYVNYFKYLEKRSELRSASVNLFFPDSSIFKHLAHENLEFSMDSTEDLYILRRFSNKLTLVSSNIGEISRKRFLQLDYVSKKDFKIVKTLSCLNVDIGGLEIYDSLVYNFRYEARSINKVQKQINSFSPLKESPVEVHSKSLTTDIFPSYNLQDTLFDNFDQSQVKSDFFLIDFWYRSCGPCLIQFKALQKVGEKFSKEKLTILAVNPFDKLDGPMKSFIRKTNYPFVFLFNGRELGDKLKINMFPTTILYDNRTRKIITFHSGVQGDILEHISEAILNYNSQELKKLDSKAAH